MRFFTPFFYRTRMFVRWMNGTCIETPPQHAEGEDEPVVFSFFTDISANPAIIDLVTALSKSVQNTLGMLNKYLTRWRRYRLLWKLDKVGVHQSLQRFKPTECVTIIVLRCVAIIVWTPTVPRGGGWGGGVLKSFTHIEHRAGAVGRDGLGHLIPVLTPEYLLPSQWVPVLTLTH